MIDREKVHYAIRLQTVTHCPNCECELPGDDAADAAIASVLEQLREPSDAMYEAGADTMDEQGNYEGSPAAIWQAMLKVAFLQPADSSNPAE